MADRKPDTEAKVEFTLRLKKETYDKLARIKDDSGVPIQTTIRKAIEAFLREKRRSGA